MSIASRGIDRTSGRYQRQSNGSEVLLKMKEWEKPW